MTRIETVVIVQRDSKILLGLKHPMKKFGGKWNGFGGGLEDGESLEECAIRETYTETGITPIGLKKLGKILFHFPTTEEDHEVHFYRAIGYKGRLDTSKDFIKYREFSLDELEGIYNKKMMPADKHWLPLFIKGESFKGEVYFDREMQNPKISIKRVESLD